LSLFRIAIRDEVYDDGTLVESRVTHGEASQKGREIVATDRGARDLVPEPVRIAVPGARVRVVTRATDEEVSTTITVTKDGISIVTTPEHLERDMKLLERRLPAGRFAGTLPAVPLLWRNGSAAVLLHEAAGHPLERGAALLELPPWLHVDITLALLRESFRDVPLRRMQHVHVTQTGAPFEQPADVIQIDLLAGGGYDPLTDIVTIRVAVSDAGAFDIVVPRERIGRSFLGARGEPERYPGVICSREGQELYVASSAPEILTTWLT
jgi:hypothetical protein